MMKFVITLLSFLTVVAFAEPQKLDLEAGASVTLQPGQETLVTCKRTVPAPSTEFIARYIVPPSTQAYTITPSCAKLAPAFAVGAQPVYVRAISQLGCDGSAYLLVETRTGLLGTFKSDDLIKLF